MTRPHARPAHAPRERRSRLGATVALWLIVLAGGLPARAQTTFDAAALERLALEELRETRTPGATIAVIRGGDVIFTRGLGVADVETGTPMRPEMLFRLGSTTKMMTAAALVLLAEEGRLGLGEPIGKVASGLHPSIARLTPHQLLTHTAGVRDEAPMFGRHDESALGEGVRAMTDTMLFTGPGRLFSYSNPGYWLAGFAAEAAAGRPYADVMADRLFPPLGMSRTTLRPLLAMTWPLAQGHEARAGEPPAVVRPAANNAATWPAGSVFSNVNDLSRWVVALLNGGRLDGARVLSPSSIATLTAGHVATPDPATRYGYGVNVGTWRGTRVWEHAGSRAGYGSSIRMAPEQRVGVVVLANRTGTSLPKTTTRALEMLLGLERDTPRVEARPVTRPVTEPGRYVGAYSQTQEADVRVQLRGDALVLRQRDEEWPLVAIGTDRFEIHEEGQPARPILFVRSPDGGVEFVYVGSRALRRLPVEPAR